MKKGLAMILAVVCACLFLTSCECDHEWEEATCQAPKTCTKCGKTADEQLGDHQWEDATCTEPKTCKLCGEKAGQPLGHTPGEWIETQAASCTQEGSKTTTCTVCGETVTETIPKTEHVLADWEIQTPATYSDAGTRIQKCTVCGQIINSESYNMTEEEKNQWLKANCQKYSFDEIARNPSEYNGKYAVFTGEVIQVMEGYGYDTLRVNITKQGTYSTYWTDTIYVKNYAKSSTRVLEDDVITMYGQLKGETSYQSVLGSTVTLPQFDAYIVEIQ